MDSLATAARHSLRSKPRLVNSVAVDGYSQSRSRPLKLLDLASVMEESMNDLRVLAWLAIEAKVVASAPPPPMDRRVWTEGFFCCTVWVKVEN